MEQFQGKTMSQYALFPPEDPDLVTGLSVGSISWRNSVEIMRNYHYLGRPPGTTAKCYGLYRGGEVMGAIIYGNIFRKNAARICGVKWADSVLELSRLWVTDELPRNTESWFIARSLRLLRADRPDIAILLSYADSNVGHVGTIYQATNWLYTGASTEGQTVDSDGNPISRRKLKRGATGYTRAHRCPKHRYVMFLGARHTRRELRHSLRWPVLPYPKNHR